MPICSCGQASDKKKGCFVENLQEGIVWLDCCSTALVLHYKHMHEKMKKCMSRLVYVGKVENYFCGVLVGEMIGDRIEKIHDRSRKNIR